MTDSQSFFGGCKEKYPESFLGWAVQEPAAGGERGVPAAALQSLVSGKEANAELESFLWRVSVVQEDIMDLFPLCIIKESVKVGLKQLDWVRNIAKA